ncbi:hypothetical protein DMENIID0001_033160 [Sergentomyia squamirostris]
MEFMSIKSENIGCCQKGNFEMIKNFLQHEDFRFISIFLGFLITLILCIVIKWSKRRKEGLRGQTIRKFKVITSEDDSNSSDEEDQSTEEISTEEEEIKTQLPNRHIEVIGDHLTEEESRYNFEDLDENLSRDDEIIPKQLLNNSNEKNFKPKDSGQENKETIQETTILSKEMEASEVSLKNPENTKLNPVIKKTSKDLKLRIDPLEYRMKRMKKSSQDLKVAFGSRISTDRCNFDFHNFNPGSYHLSSRPSSKSATYSVRSFGPRTNSNLSIKSSATNRLHQIPEQKKL